jgi:hypothetical protein
MTPEQERALLAATTAGLDDELRDAYARLLDLIREGVPARDAVQQVVESFAVEMADTMAAAFSAILANSVGSEDVMQMQVGAVTLSRRLYTESTSAGEAVRSIVDRHAKGFQDARALALQLFEGYAFREPDAEPLQFNRRNDKLPKYLREALLTDSDLAGQIERALAKMQVAGLKTQALRAAYAQALDALDGIEKAGGQALLDKRIKIAWFERMRYFATRIAQTELHRAYAQRQAIELLDDTDVEFVQWRMAPTHSIDDICDYFAGVDRHGLGPGVYPKRLAPVAPAHPYCKCVLSPRLDLTGRRARENEGADMAYFRTLDPSTAARVAGSNDKLDRVLKGADPLAVHNERIDPLYKVHTVEQSAGGAMLGG